jgi:hypothetical protein
MSPARATKRWLQEMSRRLKADFATGLRALRKERAIT